jgi:hypothetical protein
MSPIAHHDTPPFSGPTVANGGHCGHGWTRSLPHPVAIDPEATMRALGIPHHSK